MIQQQQQQQRSVLLSYINHILRWNMSFVRLLSISFIYILFIFTFCIDFGGISLHIWTMGIVLGGRLGVDYGCRRAEEREILFFWFSLTQNIHLEYNIEFDHVR